MTTAGNKVDGLHICDGSKRHDNLSLVIECDNCDIKDLSGSGSVQTCSLNLLIEALRLLIGSPLIDPETSSKKQQCHMRFTCTYDGGDFIESSLRHCSYLRKIIFQLNNRVDFLISVLTSFFLQLVVHFLTSQIHLTPRYIFPRARAKHPFHSS